MKSIVFKPPSSCLGTAPDDNRYKGKFDVGSASSNRIYRISFDVAKMCWVCSCMGCIRHGQCKHLTACGLRGCKFGKNFSEAKKYGFMT